MEPLLEGVCGIPGLTVFRVATAQRVKYNMIKLKKIETIFDEGRERWTAGKVCSKPAPGRTEEGNAAATV